MTLVELLVVVTIIMLLAALTLPRLRPEMERSRVREAARSIQLYLSSARSQAMATGRTCGVQIERLPAEWGCSMSLTQVETPPLYGGDTVGAIATVRQSAPPVPGKFYYCTITMSPPPLVPLFRLDQIQVGYQGLWITLDNNNAAGGASGAITNPARLTGYVDASRGEIPAWSAQPISGPFSVKRWPTKSIAPALQLPSPACIDLTWSGVDPVNGSAPTWFLSKKSNMPVTIMFATNGSVDKIYVTVNSAAGETYHEVKVASPIYLLVGTRENVVNPPTPGNQSTNLNNIANLWVAINAATGMTFVTDMAASGTDNNALTASRAFARESSAMGGK